MIDEIGIIINIIALILLIVCLKTTKYISKTDVIGYEDIKAWHTFKLPFMCCLYY